MKRAGVKATKSRVETAGKLVIFGVGLIGGSLALALKKRQAVARIVGVGRSRANLLAARRLASSMKSRPIPRSR